MELKQREKIGLRTALFSSTCNVIVALGKIIFGILGNSYALIADGVESTLDIISSIIVWGGLKIASEPADSNHPYGHGKAESLAGVIVSVILIAAGIGIGYNGIARVLTPNVEVPKNFTLYVFIIVIVIKEILYQYTMKVANLINSSSMKAEAWHHRSDAITTVFALAGVFIAIHYDYPKADGFAGILCGLIIIFNGGRILLSSANEVMDSVASDEIYDKIKQITLDNPGIKAIENIRIRKSGLQYLLDIEIQVDPNISVMDGHTIAHELEDALLKNNNLQIIDVIIHVEPYIPKSESH
jgi:cation diffusion facilitator family transporter